jgi:hypothetical protein
MTIQEFINQEVEHATKVIREEYKEVTSDFIKEVNESLEDIIYTQIRDSVSFTITDKMTGKIYNSMLGKGENIDYKDLYEIFMRLYKVHHISQEFTLEFEGYKTDVNRYNLSENPSNYEIFTIVKKAIDLQLLNASDFQ